MRGGIGCRAVYVPLDERGAAPLRRHSWRRAATIAGSAVLLSIPLGVMRGLPTHAEASSPATVGANSADCPSGVLTPHAPIAINSDADWTAASGVTGGTGTAADPFVVSCWSIAAYSSSSRAGVFVANAAGNVSYVIRDVSVTEPGGAAYGISLPGSTNGTAVVALDSVSGVSNGSGFYVQNFSASLSLEQNLATNNSVGYQITVASLLARGNVGTANTQQCEAIQAGGQVSGDQCTGNGGAGFLVGGNLVFTGNIARNNAGFGIGLNGGVDATGNVSDSNSSFGIYTTAGNTVTGNVVTSNRSGGIQMATSGNTISDNIIEYNGGPGITGNSADYPGFFGWENEIYDNHIGYNAYGIVTFGLHFANAIWGTDWLDGSQSLSNLGSLNTVVDAGSNKNGVPGRSVLFSDYVATMAVQPTSNTVGQNGPCPVLSGNCNLAQTQPLQPGIIVAITWDFGDGSRVTVIDPTQGQGPPPPVSHTYTSARAYEATLTVSTYNQDTATNQSTQLVSYADTVPVMIS